MEAPIAWSSLAKVARRDRQSAAESAFVLIICIRVLISRRRALSKEGVVGGDATGVLCVVDGVEVDVGEDGEGVG